MEHIWDKVVKVFAALAGAIAGLFGGWGITLTVLIGAMAADYVSGVVVAIMGRSGKTAGGGLSSTAGWNGLLRKGLMMLVVLVAAALDAAMGGGGHVIRDAACWFYIANEGLSLLENLTLAGVPFSPKIKQLLEQTKDSESKPPTDKI